MKNTTSATKGSYERVLWLDAQIREGAYPNVRSLAEKFEMTERNAHRDVAFLKVHLGAPINYHHQKKGYYYSQKNYQLPTVMMSQGELLAICLAKNLLEQYKEAPFINELQTAFEKICQALPSSVSVDLDALRSAITFDLGPARDVDPHTYDAILEAIQSKRKLKMRYYTASRGVHTEREVAPCKLYNHQNDWYLVAFDSLRNDLRDFAVSRIQEVRILNQSFELSSEIDLEAHMEHHFGGIRSDTAIPVSVWFDDYQARWMRERQWTGEAGREEHPDGSLTLHLTVYDLDSVKRWIMQYGSHARALQPQALIDKIAQEVAAMSLQYPNKEGEN